MFVELRWPAKRRGSPPLRIRGEGVFIEFKTEAIDQWLARPQVQKRGRQLDTGFIGLVSEHQGTHRKFPGLPYIFLHSLTHICLSLRYPSNAVIQPAQFVNAFTRFLDWGTACFFTQARRMPKERWADSSKLAAESMSTYARR